MFMAWQLVGTDPDHGRCQAHVSNEIEKNENISIESLIKSVSTYFASWF